MNQSRIEQVQAYLPAMDEMFKELLQKFLSSDFLLRSEVPKYGGIYVFYNDDKPIYVGRANNIKARIAGHTRPSSGHNSANFAFNLAKLELAEKLAETKMGREALMSDSEFVEKFTEQKGMLSASKIKCIEIDNDIIQTMFEPYLSVKLGTYPENNSFENH